ncbi:MAG: hemin uptake protein HemP [Planctomyces sp.]|nr:hemin uptake protein HemP [Planctomyces sp.]
MTSSPKDTSVPSDAESGSSTPESRVPLPLSPTYDFETLAAGAQEVQIEHRGQKYRLRITRNGGLILNK